MDEYARIRQHTDKCADDYHARMILWSADESDPDLRENARLAAWEFMHALTAELDYLNTCSPDPEVLQRLAQVTNLQTQAANDLRLLVED